jgi:hypothetical protein
MRVPQRFFAMFGRRNSGKTVYLAALYGGGKDEGSDGLEYHVESNENATHIYLSQAGRNLLSGKWPEGTPWDEQQLGHKMSLRLTVSGRAYQLRIPDVGGEVTRRAQSNLDYETMNAELKAKVLEEFQDYHGFLVFVPGDATHAEQALEYKWEVDALVSALKERTPDGGMISRPVAILVSKWDLREPRLDGVDHETQSREFLESVYPELAAGLKATCKNLRVFPVSSTGPLIDGHLPIPLRPFNLIKPLVWLLETADGVMLEGVRDYIERNRPRLFRREPDDPAKRSHIKVALSRLHGVLEDLPPGDFAADAQRLQAELRRTALRRRLSRGGAVLVLVVVGLIGLGLFRDRIAYHRAQKYLSGSINSPAKDVISQVSKIVEDPSHLVGRIIGWWSQLHNDLDRYRKDFQERRYQELTALYPPVDEPNAETFLRKIQDFESDFPDSPYGPEIAAMRRPAEDLSRRGRENRHHQRIIESYKEFQVHRENHKVCEPLKADCKTFIADFPGSCFDAEVQRIQADVEVALIVLDERRAFDQLQEELAKNAEDTFKCYQLCRVYLSKSSLDNPHRSEVKKKGDDYLRTADGRAWEDVQSFSRKYPDLFPEQLDKCSTYMSNGSFELHQKEASEFRFQIAKNYDRSLYEIIRRRALDGNRPETILAVHNLCLKYLGATVPEAGKAMTSEVEVWNKWFDDWARGKEFSVRVVWVRIDRGSAWHHQLTPFNPEVWVSVTVNDKTFSTDHKSIYLDKEERDLPGSSLGPFFWKWGDPEVTVSFHHKDASPPKFESSFDDDHDFKIRNLNRPISYDGTKVSFRLECPEAKPPVLPPYKDLSR